LKIEKLKIFRIENYLKLNGMEDTIFFNNFKRRKLFKIILFRYLKISGLIKPLGA